MCCAAFCHIAISDDGINGVVPATVVALKAVVHRSRQCISETLLRWTLRCKGQIRSWRLGELVTLEL